MSEHSPIQYTVERILEQAAANGVKITDTIRQDAREFLKAQLYQAGHETFKRIIATRSTTQKFSRKVITAKDIVCYRGEAFNLVHFAPGGLTEVDPFGRPVPEDSHLKYCE